MLRRGFSALERQVACSPRATRRTMDRDGAFAAERIARQTNGGAELHYCLIPSRRIAAVEQAVGDLLRVGVSVVRPARQHAANIAIHHGMCESETNTCYS